MRAGRSPLFMQFAVAVIAVSLSAMTCMLWGWCYAAGVKPESVGHGSSDIYALTKGAPVPDHLDAVLGRVLVKFKAGKKSAALQRISHTRALRALKERKLRGTAWHLLTIDASKGVKAAVETLRADPDVLYAEPDYRVRAFGPGVPLVPNDSRFNELWGMHNTGQAGGTADADIDAPEAWQSTTSSSVLAAVIDTGIDRNHADLAANMWTNLAELNGSPGVDDDGNGYVDDIYGWDFANNDSDPMDDHSHGTHCSGTIGGIGNNAIGVAGVCWGAKIMAVKFLDGSGWGSTSAAIEAVNYAVMMGAKVLSNSWGGDPYSQALKDAIDAANAAGVLFVASAGNSGANNDVSAYASYPSSFDCPNIIAVAATDRNDALAWFSSYGPTSVDLGAPGVDTLSTTPENTYSLKSGTSMAAPHVAGACALVWGAVPGMTHSDVKNLILAGADPKPSLAGKCLSGGRLNVANSLGLISGRQLRIVAPNGGESYETGYTVDIHWFVIGAGWQPGIDTVALTYSPNNGSGWIPISGADNVPFDIGSFAWSTAGLEAGGQYLVQATFNGDPAINDPSDGPFAITGPLDHFDFLMASPQSDGLPVRGTCRVTAEDSSGRAIGTFGVFNTAGRFPVVITAADAVIEGLGGPGNELSAANFPAGVANVTALGMTVNVAAVPITRAFVATSADGRTGISASVWIQEQTGYFTELFDTSPFDLAYSSVMFVPNGSGDYCAAFTVRPIASLPVNPAGGTVLSALDTDYYAQVILTGGAQVQLYGVSYSRFYVGRKGYITFGTGSEAENESFASHFALPRISALFDDLSPRLGDVSYKQLADRVAVTWRNVRQTWASDSNTFQIEMFYDGHIVLSYLEIAATDGLAGISVGNGVPPDFIESNLSAYQLLPPDWNFPPVAQSFSTLRSWNTTSTIMLQASDDGLPDPPVMLNYIFFSLPAHGSLDDPAPGGGAIVTAPYTLLDHGNQVRYTPATGYSGADAFQFEAYDSDLFSNVAQVDIVVEGPPPEPRNPMPADGAKYVPLDSDLWWNEGNNLIQNGGFEMGNFTCWTQVNLNYGCYVINDGIFDPRSSDGPLPPASGDFSAMTNQDGPGTNTLYQEVAIPSGPNRVTLSWKDMIRNHYSAFHHPDQECRVEIWDTSNNVIGSVYATNPGDPLLTNWNLREFDISAFAGQAVRVAFTVQDSLWWINFHVDDVALTVGPPYSSGEGDGLSVRTLPVVTRHAPTKPSAAPGSTGETLASTRVYPRQSTGAHPLPFRSNAVSAAATVCNSKRAGAAVQQSAITYDVYLDVTDPPQVPIASDLDQPTCDPTPAQGQQLDFDTTYYWQVVAKNIAGPTPGPVWHFTTISDSDTVDHFAWSDIGSPQCTGVPFETTITAKDLNGNTVEDFTGTVNISCWRLPLLLPVSPSISGNFTGGTWTGSIAVLEAGQAVFLRADDGGGHIGESNVFEVKPPQPTIFPSVTTECPAVETTCPPVNTQCPATTTACPPMNTSCPPVETNCPSVETACPTVATQCPFVDTACPFVETLCPPVATLCPAEGTCCGWPGPTFCPPIETECPSSATSCPPAQTACPVSNAQLIVQSTPITGVVITGSPSGTTDYTTSVPVCPVAQVSLTAPVSLNSGGTDYSFVRWTVGGVEQPIGQVAVTFNMTGDTIALATYSICYHLSLKAGGWNLVSLPIEPDEPAPASVFGQNLLGVYAWWTGGAGAYIVPTAIEAKRGYWVAVSADTDLDVRGSLSPTSTVHLVLGWNLVGPRADVALPSGVLAVYGWNWPDGLPHYIVPTQCMQGRGYWVAASGEMDIW